MRFPSTAIVEFAKNAIVRGVIACGACRITTAPRSRTPTMGAKEEGQRVHLDPLEWRVRLGSRNISVFALSFEAEL